MPTINWNVDKTTEEEEGLGSHHLLKQIAGMFAVAHRMIEDLSISKNFNLNPRGSSEMETFLYNFRQGLLARLGRCGDGLREIQSQHNSSKSFLCDHMASIHQKSHLLINLGTLLILRNEFLDWHPFFSYPIILIMHLLIIDIST